MIEIKKLFAGVGSIVILVFLAIIIAAMISEILKLPREMIKPQSPLDVSKTEGFGSMSGSSAPGSSAVVTRFNMTSDENDLGGHTSGRGIVIHWNSKSRFGCNDDGVSVEQVLSICAGRLTFLQNTLQASDNQAQAIFKLSEAIDILNGDSVELSDIHKKEPKQ